MAVTDIQPKGDLPNRHSFRQAVYQVWTIARKEITSNCLNLKIIIAFLALTFILILSAHLLAIDYEQRLANFAINQEAQRDPIVGGVVRYELPDGSFFYSTGIGHDAPLHPPQPLSTLIKGLDDELDRPVAIGQRIGFGPRQQENALSALFDTPDTLFVVKLLVSLFALFFSLDVMTREKEAGVLIILLSYPIRRRELILGKILGAFVSMLPPFALAYSATLIYLYFVHGLIQSKEELMRVLTVFGLCLLYSLVFICLGILISTITSKTKTAVVAALLTWGALVFVLPAALVLAAKLVAPTPSYNELNARLYEAQQQIIQAEIRAHPGAQTIFDTPNRKQAIFRLLETDREITDDYMAKTWKQVDQARSFAMLSPAGALTFGSSDMAGTGAVAYRSYLDHLQSGRDVIIDALKRRWDMAPREGAKLVQEAMESVPLRQYQPEPFSVSARSAAQASFSLLTWLCLFALAALWQVERYDVR